MKRIIFAASLFATPALAQQPPLQQQLDIAVSQVTTIMVGLKNQIAQDQQQIATLQQQIADLKKAAEPTLPK